MTSFRRVILSWCLGLSVISLAVPPVSASPLERTAFLNPPEFQLPFSPDSAPTLVVLHSVSGSGQFEGTPFTFVPTNSQSVPLLPPSAADTGLLTGTVQVGLRTEHSNNFDVDVWVFDDWTNFNVALPPNLRLGAYSGVPFPVEADFNGSSVSAEFLYSFEIRGFEIVQAGPVSFTPLPFLPQVDVPIYFDVTMPVELRSAVDVWVDLADYNLAAPIQIIDNGTLSGLANMTARVLGPLPDGGPGIIVPLPDDDDFGFQLTNLRISQVTELTGTFSSPWIVGPGDVIGDNLTFSATSNLQLSLSIDPFSTNLDGTFAIPETSSLPLASLGLLSAGCLVILRRNSPLHA